MKLRKSKRTTQNSNLTTSGLGPFGSVQPSAVQRDGTERDEFLTGTHSQSCGFKLHHHHHLTFLWHAVLKYLEILIQMFQASFRKGPTQENLAF